MEVEKKKKIELENLKEVISENLRILNEDDPKDNLKNQNSPLEQNFNLDEPAPKSPAYQRQEIPEEEFDVTELELKNINFGKKILRGIRKTLHREIRHWIVYPFQKKQTNFNQKTVQNFSQTFNEIDYQSERIDQNARKLQGLKNKIDEIPTEVDKKIDLSNQELDQKLDSTSSELNQKLDSTSSELNQKLDSTSSELNQKLDSTSSDLTQKLDTTKSDLTQKLDTTKSDLIQKLDSNTSELDQKLDTTKSDLTQKLETTKSELDQKLDTTQSEVVKSIDSIEPKIKSVLDENNTAQLKKYLEIQSDITKIYLSNLERSPDKDGLQYYLNQILNNKLKISDLEKLLRNSEEYRIIQKRNKLVKKYCSQIKEPIFIFGVPRTGTTMLHSIICAHKKLAWFCHTDINEWISDEQKYQYEKYFGWLKSKKKKIPMSEETLFVFGKRLGKGLKEFGHPPKGTSKIPIEGEIFWRKYFGENYVKDISVEQKIQLVKNLSELITEQSKPRFVGKAPNHSIRLFALKKIFPDSKFINVARDPRAVISSMLQRLETEGKFEPGIPIQNKSNFDDGDLVAKFATLYKEVTDAIFEFSKAKNSNSFITIFYEDLMADPTKITKQIIKFCGLDKPKSIKRMMPPIRKGTLKKWTKILSPDDEKKIFDIVGPSLKKMKYPYKL